MAASLTEFSNGLTSAVEKGGANTVLVDARKRYPASGIALAEDLVLTADHVVTREEGINVVLADGNSFAATIAGRDPGSDLAVLRITEKVLTPAKTSDTVKVGQLVLAIGRPNSAGIQASWGIVTAISGPTRTFRGGMLDEFIQSETTPYPGFSGGPLINTEGDILGLNTSGLTRGSSLTIPVKVAWRTGDALAKNGTVKRGYLGVRTQPVEIPDASRQALKREQSNGLLVLWLEEGGPAESGGLLVGDIIVAISGQPVGDADDLFSALNSDTVGNSIAVEVLRGGRPGDGLCESGGEEVIRVLLGVSSPALRAGLRALLSSDRTIKVVNDSLEDDSEANVIITLASRAFLLENGAVDSPSASLLLLSDDPINVRDLKRASRGWGILPTDASAEELSAAVHALSQGLIVGTSTLLFASESEPLSQGLLTDRESEVLGLLSRGLANKQIAVALGISEHTVKFHVSSIYTKLNVTNRTEAVRAGLHGGWIVL